MTSAGRAVTEFFHSEMWKVTALSRLKGHCLTPKAGLQQDVQEFRFQTDFILERRQGDVAAKFHINFKHSCSQVVVRIGKPSTSNSLLSLKSLHVKRSF